MKKKIALVLLVLFGLSISGGISGCFSREPAQVYAKETDYTSETYTWNNKISNTSGTITGYKGENGILLLPVKEVVEPSGYVMEECPRCGKDEVYRKEDEDAAGKGHYFVNWYQALLSYSVSSQTVELSAANEKIDGKTCGPLDLFSNMGLTVSVDEEKKTISVSSNLIEAAYFYSSTCDTCEKTEKFLNEMEEKYPNLNIRKYNIYEVEDYDLLVEYGKVYGLPEEKRGFSPSLFIADGVLIGAEIEHELEDRVEDYFNGPATTILEDAESETEPESGSVWGQLAAALGLGFVNGLSPCSLSIFLFLLSLLLVGKEQMLRCGLSFLAGKALMFFLLGTILYNVINSINMSAFSRWLDVVMIVFAVCFALLNLVDFFKARAEKYGEMNLQLPKKVKKMNYAMLKWGNRFSAAKWGAAILFGIGMIVSTGEFLCTGQIYLSSIVIMVQKGADGMIPTLLLAVYSIAFVLPLVILMIVVYFGKKIFGMSEAVLEKIPWIKLISAVLFVAMAVYLIAA